MSNRDESILSGLDLKRMIGAEIGPLDRPLVRRSDAGSGGVIYVDHCDTTELRRRWESDPNVDEAKIEVDAVWRSNPLRESIAAVVGADVRLDYVIASHVIEHVPNLVGWLQELSAVLKERGSLRLAVPDKRYTFDILRNTTTLAEVFDGYVRQRKVPSSSRVLDFALNSVEVDCQKAWRNRLDLASLRHMYTHEQAIRLAQDAEHNGTYHDVHCWVFTPASFASLMLELARDGLLEFGCERLVVTQRDTFEFFVHMTHSPDPTERVRSWQIVAEAEQKQDFSAIG